jgi:glycosyltransferase involved in cell wall biosynthesis
MLSILIPTYNFDCSKLVEELYTQCTKANITFEIVVGNDGSTSSLDKLRALQGSLKNYRLLDFKENRGRSAIRNILIKESKYDRLLFIDSDMLICKNDFIETYLKETAPMVSGGLDVIEDNNPDYILHKKYEKNRSANIATTSNLLIHKGILNEFKFVDLKKYGYEDIIFSYQVSKKYEVKFIPNPLIHCGAIKTENFIKRLEDATEVLVYLFKNEQYRNDIVKSTKLLRTYLKIRNFNGLFLLCFNILKPLILKQLKSKNPNLYLLDIYKLGLLCKQIKP